MTKSIYKFVLIIMSGFVYIASSWAQVNKTPVTASFPQISANSANANYATLLAIDMDMNGIISEDSILQGKDGLLLLNRRADQRSPNLADFNYFKSMDDLALVDENKDGRIDGMDSTVIANKLYLLFLFRGGQRPLFRVLTDPGIRAILLSKEHLQNSPANLSPDFHRHANRAIMSDGSRRQVKPVKIHVRHISPRR